MTSQLQGDVPCTVELLSLLLFLETKVVCLSLKVTHLLKTKFRDMHLLRVSFKGLCIFSVLVTISTVLTVLYMSCKLLLGPIMQNWKRKQGYLKTLGWVLKYCINIEIKKERKKHRSFSLFVTESDLICGIMLTHCDNNSGSKLQIVE